MTGAERLARLRANEELLNTMVQDGLLMPVTGVYAIRPSGWVLPIPTIADAAGIDYAGCRVVITAPHTLTSNLTFPADRKVTFEDGGMLVGGSGVTVTFLKGFRATKSKHFDGGINVKGKISKVYPQWWGAVAGSFSEDSGPGIQAAIDCANGYPDGAKPVVRITAGVYRVEQFPVVRGLGLNIKGDGSGKSTNNSSVASAGGTTLNYVGEEQGTSNADVTLVAGMFKLGSETESTRALTLSGMSLWCHYKINGISGTNANGSHFKDLYIYQPKIGVYLEEGCFGNLWEMLVVHDPTVLHLDLRLNVHNNVFLKCIFTAPSTILATNRSAYVRIGEVGTSSAINFIGCNFDVYSSDKVVFVKSPVKGLSFSGGYIEMYGTSNSTHCMYLAHGSGISIAGTRFTATATSSNTGGRVPHAIVFVPIDAGHAGLDFTGNYVEGFGVSAVLVNENVTNVFAAGNSLLGNMVSIPVITGVSNDEASWFDKGVLNTKAVNIKGLALGAPVSRTISGGVLTIDDESFVRVETEGGAATDDLTTIAGVFSDGHILILQAKDTDHTVVVKDGVGNINIASDSSLPEDRSKLMLIYNSVNSQFEGLVPGTN